jgi:hypothetical protein
MEVRSSRRMRILVTQMAGRGLSVNEIARALISMVARSMTRSNQRPNTLMQDRSPPVRQRLLQRTAGPYIWVNRYRIALSARCPFITQSLTSEQTSPVDALGPISDIRARSRFRVRSLHSFENGFEDRRIISPG